MTIIAAPYREIVHYHGLNVDSFSRLQVKIFANVLLDSLYKSNSCSVSITASDKAPLKPQMYHDHVSECYSFFIM